MTFFVRMSGGGDTLLHLITGKTLIIKAKGYCINLAEAKEAILLGSVGKDLFYYWGKLNWVVDLRQKGSVFSNRM